MEILPDDALILVFKAVGQTSAHNLVAVIPQVCKRWRDVCKRATLLNLSLRDLLRVRGRRHMFGNDALAAILSAFSAASLRSFDFGAGRQPNSPSSPSLTDDAAVTLARQCPKLETVIIEGGTKCGITEAALQTLAQNCQRLSRLVVSGLDLSHINVHMAALTELEVGDPFRSNIEELFPHCTNLKALRLHDIRTQSSPQFLGLLLINCQNIAVIEFGRGSVADIGERFHNVDFSTLPQMNSLLAIRFCSRRRAENHTLNDAFVRGLASRCPNLVQFELLHCPAVTDAGLAQVNQRCPHLVKIRLHDTPAVTSAGRQLFRKRHLFGDAGRISFWDQWRSGRNPYE